MTALPWHLVKQKLLLLILILAPGIRSFRHSTWSPIRSSNRYRRYTHPWDTNVLSDAPSGPMIDNLLTVDQTHSNRAAIDPATYYADWHRFLDGSSGQRCYDIPRNMSLCQNLEYSRMILPNFLQHEDLKEAVDQSQVWVSLARTHCHPEVNKFLCSLYAPICVEEFQERLIHPCKELCEDVKQKCLPKMLQFGFGWPDIVKCSQFPPSSSKMCVRMTEVKGQSCFGCTQNPSFQSVISAYCAADVAFKGRLLHISRSNSTTHPANILIFDRQLRIFKSHAPVMKWRRSIFEVECHCDLLEKYMKRKDRRLGKWFIMGKVGDDSRLQVTHISRFRKKSTGLREAIRAIKRKDHNLCSRKPDKKPKQDSEGDASTSTDRDRSTSSKAIGYINDQARRNVIRQRTAGGFASTDQRKSHSLNRRQRSPHRSQRRSLVRRSQRYHYPWSPMRSDTEQSGILSVPSNSPWSQAPPIATNHAHTIFMNYSDRLDELPLLESEKDLFSPNDLRSWL